MKHAPTVGRIVHYAAYGTPGGEFPAGVCRAAIVTEVSTESADTEGRFCTLGLCVLNPSGIYFNRGVQQDRAAECDGSTPGTWHWPTRKEYL